MRLMGTAEDPADPICELVSIEQPLGFCDLPLAVHPLGFYGVKPRTLGGQEARDYAYSTAAFFDLAVVGADPVAHPTAFVPARVVPDQQQGLLAPLFELVAAPLKKLRGYGAHGTAIHESKPRPVEPRHIQPVAGEGFGVGSSFLASFWSRCTGRPVCSQECKLGLSKRENQLSNHRSPRPTPDGSGRAGSADLEPSFSLVLRIRALHPSLGPLPTHPQP